MLTPKQARFVEEYLVDLNAAQAAVRAGYSADAARQIGAENLSKLTIADAIAEAQAARSARTAITADMVLRRWWDLATVDANELSQLRRVNCRNCWGNEHAYQWTEDEYRLACDDADAKEKPAPDDLGGMGFDRTRVAHPDCPECQGEGQEVEFFHDTRKLSGPARLLYAGVKRTKDGFELKTHSQEKAMENVARHLGMFVDKIQAEVKHTYAELGDEELDREIAQLTAALAPKG